jgi:hypothetical protein
MWLGHAFEVCERISEAQAILHDQAEGGCSSDQTLDKLRTLLSEPGLHEAMYNLGYFAKNPAAFPEDSRIRRSPSKPPAP